MASEQLFEIIETNNKVYTCIIDYVSNRHVMIYDLTNTEELILRMMAIKWKLYHYDKRFSIFKALYFPTVSIPPITVINRLSIIYTTADLKLTRPKRKKVRISVSPIDDSSV